MAPADYPYQDSTAGAVNEPIRTTEAPAPVLNPAFFPRYTKPAALWNEAEDAGAEFPSGAGVVRDLESITVAVVDAEPATVEEDETLALTATLVYSDEHEVEDANAYVTWASATPATATVSAAGVVTGVAAGEVDITATRGEVAGTLKVTVTTPQ